MTIINFDKIIGKEYKTITNNILFKSSIEFINCGKNEQWENKYFI